MSPGIRPSPNRDPLPRAELKLPLTSLLWPNPQPPVPPASTPWETDLGLGELVSALALHGRYAPPIRQILTLLVTDPATIRWRQAVLVDFLHNPALLDRILALLPRLASLQEGNSLLGNRQRNLLLTTADRLAELEAYIDVTRDLHAILDQTNIQSPALRQLRDDLAALIANPNYQMLAADLPELRAPLHQIRSLTIGLNLDLELRPASAVLLAINQHQFGASYSWLERIIGYRVAPDEETGIAPLHRVPDDPNLRPLTPLFQDLDRLLTQIAAPVAKALTRYARTATGSLLHLEFELAFFAGAVRLFNQLQARGYPGCIPEIAPSDDRILDITGLVNTGLALRGLALVPSDVRLDDDGRIAVLTGPNSGGKTTYLRSIGLAAVLFQAGLLVPGQYARMSPVDAILTHFPGLETRQTGRLEEEAVRLRKIFQSATRYSLVLLNETLSSTASGEALYLAQDMLAALRAIGTRTLYATHLTELAERLDEIEKLAAGDCRLFSLVAGVMLNEAGQTMPTYTITRGRPHGRSYAYDIARKHGLSLEQILAARGEEKT